MGIPFNELNRAFDLGFKPMPNGNNSYLPTNLQPVGSLSDDPHKGLKEDATTANGNQAANRPSPSDLAAARELRSLLEGGRISPCPPPGS
jgi:hypothetical protein